MTDITTKIASGICRDSVFASEAETPIRKMYQRKLCFSRVYITNMYVCDAVVMFYTRFILKHINTIYYKKARINL